MVVMGYCQFPSVSPSGPWLNAMKFPRWKFVRFNGNSALHFRKSSLSGIKFAIVNNMRTSDDDAGFSFDI